VGHRRSLGSAAVSLLLALAAKHWWTRWSSVEFLECPDGDLVTVEVRERFCRLCGYMQEVEVIVSCG
jgi:hypothetical protein